MIVDQRTLILLIWQYCITQSYLKIHCNSYQNSSTSSLFCRNGKADLQFPCNCKWLQRATEFLGNKRGRESENVVPDFRTCYKSPLTKIVCYRPKDRPINQWTGIESPEINPNIYHQLIFDERVKFIQWGEEQSLQQYGAETSG